MRVFGDSIKLYGVFDRDFDFDCQEWIDPRAVYKQSSRSIPRSSKCSHFSSQKADESACLACVRGHMSSSVSVAMSAHAAI